MRSALHSCSHRVPLPLVNPLDSLNPHSSLSTCSGHRYKEHKPTGTGENTRFVCSSRGCPCAHFFFIVAEVRSPFILANQFIHSMIHSLFQFMWSCLHYDICHVTGRVDPQVSLQAQAHRPQLLHPPIHLHQTPLRLLGLRQVCHA